MFMTREVGEKDCAYTWLEDDEEVLDLAPDVRTAPSVGEGVDDVEEYGTGKQWIMSDWDQKAATHSSCPSVIWDRE